ncbi:hypothetical protein [Faecalimonas umbilicata]|uniref:hypothetical protein n=1 Tax=Faecalimonas umbilicata TaxID=1912855 RepID=UPI0039931DA8
MDEILNYLPGVSSHFDAVLRWKPGKLSKLMTSGVKTGDQGYTPIEFFAIFINIYQHSRRNFGIPSSWPGYTGKRASGARCVSLEQCDRGGMQRAAKDPGRWVYVAC